MKANNIDELVNVTIKHLGRLKIAALTRDIEDDTLIRAVGEYLGYGRIWWKWNLRQILDVKSVLQAAQKIRDEAERNDP